MLARYLLVGLLICFSAQVIYSFEIGSVSPQVAIWPFIWAYSQAAMVGVVAKGSSWRMQLMIWAGAYLALGIVLWMALEVWRSQPIRTSWRRPVVSWLLTQIALGVLAWGLLLGGVIKMV